MTTAEYLDYAARRDAGLAITYALAVCQRVQVSDAVLTKLLEAKAELLKASQAVTA